MYRTSQVYSDGSNPNARWSQNHLVKELSKTLAEDSKRKLYVGNLHFKATEYQVVKLFQEHGKIKREQFMYHRGGAKKGEPRGVMYIEYEEEEEALAAKEKMNGRLLIGRPLLVRLVDEQTSKEELMGEDDEEEEEQQSSSLMQKRTEEDAAAAAAAPGNRSSKADQIAKIKAKLAAMANEDQSAAKASKSIGGDRYRPY